MRLVKEESGQDSLWDSEFIRLHDVAGPRYTSYPTALQFHEEFTDQDYKDAVGRSNASRMPLSLYVHLPFCASLCYYCACNKVITQSDEKKRRYLDALIKEIRLKSKDFDAARPVYQMHWGGGTPTYYSDAELTELWFEIGRHFHLVEPERGEYSIEIDPRTIDGNKLGLLKGLGFNRISLGIQDFDQRVQEAINRVQSYEQIRDLLQAARNYQYRSVNFDLIYGLPYQTVASVRETITKVIDLSPDRISLFNYAHLPQRFKSQSLLPEEALPPAEEKLQILCDASNQLMNAGYVYIGMDHFAKPTDELALAQAEGSLHRNFQGYTTFKDADLVGLGVSSISLINNIYCQNTKSITEYQGLVEENNSPLNAGVVLSTDDEIRRAVIMSLLCQNWLIPAQIESQFGIRFEHYFSSEIKSLNEFVNAGLLSLQNGVYNVTPKGRLVVRKICMLFDVYLPQHVKEGRRFSRVL
ncbi:MAG: oxygen-independent coproporphyrinogen III oxidase [Pseudomonadales bacterium]|mgnify:CR=1 FL=1|jgi:oxygen-independent coproporphyrinogen III oxidase|nr:oxygen-independent coproporphyrinogen III oxidase [Pseudomonadales bacterium]MBI26879.1 oxygen-independent coproporphyrinogen III oxidase [Pseudomonadales bacterium]MEC8810508.1 oxygen-independent coproporphyrinogen III oxidase [Pseudomonadota bacterium]HAG94166.1 oxygen-independent coproporphyrinogen III oxidase [Gammaproteobacteria bacterium]HAU12740.1 oxygen-independent coproporphyrinogen III oxidase [Gammaproteobacteria bacterium]|tara:strand:+ start:18627 stop:20036 length:1410 start_codon:yes stop_codon:yes gene_type:complete